MPAGPRPAGATPQASGPGGPLRADWHVTNVAVGKGSEGFDLSPDGRELWVANAQDETVSVVDVADRKVVQTLPSTKSANRLKFTPDGRYVFVSDLGGNEMLLIDAKARRDAVAVIDLTTMAVTGEIKTGKGPDGLAWATWK